MSTDSNPMACKSCGEDVWANVPHAPGCPEGDDLAEGDDLDAADLSSMTPREIDERLAALYLEAARNESDILRAALGLHYALGERQQRAYGQKPTWPTTDAEALAACRARVADPSYEEPPPWQVESPSKAVKLWDAVQRERAEIKAKMKPLDDEFDRRGGWSRFFLVQNTGGHIHYDISAHRCSRTWTTRHGWNPELSGLTEADAVAKLGPRLCTVCFPSAPVEWTVGGPKREYCSGTTPVADTVRRQGMRRYGRCPVCDENQTLNQDGAMRKHAPKK